MDTLGKLIPARYDLVVRQHAALLHRPGSSNTRLSTQRLAFFASPFGYCPQFAEQPSSGACLNFLSSDDIQPRVATFGSGCKACATAFLSHRQPFGGMCQYVTLRFGEDLFAQLVRPTAGPHRAATE